MLPRGSAFFAAQEVVDMHLAIATWNIAAPSMAAKLAYVHGLGFEAVSFLYTAPPPDADDIGADLHALLEQYDLHVLVHGAIGDCAHAEQRPAVCEQIAQVARFQQETGRVRAMNFDPGYRTTARNHRCYDADGSASVLEEALTVLTPLGVKVGIENWVINYELAHYELLKQRLGDASLGMLLDLGHLNIAHRSGLLDGLPPAGYIKSLPLPVWEIHVHDNDGISDKHRFLGSGNIEIEPMAQALLEIGFDGYVTVEVIMLDTHRPACRRKLCATRNRILQSLCFDDS
jgi:sugar phosphate isomerase/epimerase